MADDQKMEAEIEAALRAGNPEDAARAFMTHRGGSLDAARKEIALRLAKRAKR